MPDHDPTQAFLDSLPEIEPCETFQFACHPNVACFNVCCADLNLSLTSYDALRLRHCLGLASEPFLKSHVRVTANPVTGYPLVHLKMIEGPTAACPYVNQAGCTVYEDRPSACRYYPLGRATRLDEEGRMVEQFFVVREPHCRGFEEDFQFTPRTWLEDQGLAVYNVHNDRYMALMARHRAQPPLASKHSTLVLLALYQPDRFLDFIRDMNVFSRLDISSQDQEAILDDEERRLWFGYDFVELMLYGSAPNLKPKASA